ncbi:MAG: HAD family hydrolase [Nanoarchaeota archaeon]|nr:HAD family hydrolase [Nanoarchaeota archaeon]
MRVDQLILFDLDDTLFDSSSQMRAGHEQEDVQRIVPFPGVLSFLASFPGKKALVTKETVLGLQQQKITVLGVGRFFDDVFICQTIEEKKSRFRQVLAKYHPEKCWVVGDRLDAEIRFGNELGLKTIWLCHGKHREQKPQNGLEVPDAQISRFTELHTMFSSEGRS